MTRKSSGFTLVELLVVIAIIGILVSLTLPAVQSARETSRQNRCQASLKEMASGVQSHITILGRYPSGGWGYNWVGDPGLGNGLNQPGGWIYNLLPYIDQQILHDYSFPLTGAAGTPADPNLAWVKNANATTQLTNTLNAKSADYFGRLQIALPIFICSSRRLAVTYPSSFTPPIMAVPITTGIQVSGVAVGAITVAARSDYAINAGSVVTPPWTPNPSSPLNCDAFPGPAVPPSPPAASSNQASGVNVGALTLTSATSAAAAPYSGVSFQQSMVQPAQVADGATYTYLIGEKSMNPDAYTTGGDTFDTRNMYVGMAADNYRTTDMPPAQDMAGVAGSMRFGSAHPNGTAFAFCDGSVRIIRYNIQPGLHAAMGNRADSLLTPANTNLITPDDSLLR